MGDHYGRAEITEADIETILRAFPPSGSCGGACE